MSDIIVTGLYKAFGARKVLNDVNVVFPEGKASCIMGPSGCGKSTLLKMIMGLMKPDAGSISGVPEKISAVFQEDRLCEEFSAMTNVRLAAGRSVTDDEIRACFYRLGIEASADEKVIDLSGGMKRRVAIARALMTEHHLLLLDEPFKGLDEETRKKVIEEVRKDPSTIIMVSHDSYEAELLGAKIFTPEGMIPRVQTG